MDSKEYGKTCELIRDFIHADGCKSIGEVFCDKCLNNNNCPDDKGEKCSFVYLASKGEEEHSKSKEPRHTEVCEWTKKGHEWITSCGDRCDGFAIMESKKCWKCGGIINPIKEV